MNVLTWFRQHYCRHSYRKHWSRDFGPYGGYVRQCAKCNKVIENLQNVIRSSSKHAEMRVIFMPKREHGTKLCAAGDTDDNG